MMSAMLKTIDKDYKNNPDIKWNFTKFIVDRNGNVVARFEPTENMKNVEACVEKLL
jgi:glutathione peroxidase